MSEEAKKILKEYRIKTALYMLSLVGFAWICLFNSTNDYTYGWPWFEYFLYTLISSIAYLGLVFISVILYRMSMVKINGILNEDCDPYLFLECWQKMKFGHLSKNVYHYNMAVTLTYMGDYENAWKHMLVIKTKRLRGNLRNNYYMLQCSLLYEMGMANQLNQVEEQVRAIIRNEKDEAFFRKLCASNNTARAYLNKDFDAAYRFLREKVKTADPIWFMVHKVNFAYWKGLIDKESGNYASAKDCFTFVVENGNRIACVEKAKELLAEMEAK